MHTAETFATETIKISVAEIMRMQGIDKTTASCHQALVDVFMRYLRLLGTKCQESAQLSGRNKVNLYDIFLLFQTLKIDIPTLEDYHKSLSLQKTKFLEKLKQHSKNNDEEPVIPFAYPRLEPGSFPLRTLPLTQDQIS